MKILYANLKEHGAIKGHKLFDMHWAQIFSQIGDVDVLCPSERWYGNIPPGINIISFNPETYLIKNKIINSKIFSRGYLARLCLYFRAISYEYLKYACYLDNKKHYDVIVFSTLDVLSFALGFRKFRSPKKIFIIEHMLSMYEKEADQVFYSCYKNKVNHIVMEKGAVPIYINTHGIKQELLNYIPHPLNTIAQDKILKVDWYYDVVGISNSNSEQEIKSIIEFETDKGFFRKNRIKVLFRSKSFVFDDGWLKVISGQAPLLSEEYYTYIDMAKIIVLPFDISFGLRTSGTIIDALSNNTCVLGSEFATMKQYETEYPLICHTYGTTAELFGKIKYMLKTDRTQSINLEFASFKNERSDLELVNSAKTIFKYLEE